MENTATIEARKCLRCGHEWFPRQIEKPRMCPACKTVRWDQPPTVTTLAEAKVASNG